MNDSLSFGGENQALIFNPNDNQVYGINGCGMAPTGATVDFFTEQGMKFPPAYGPLAAITPGIPGSLMIMLAEFGTLSLEEVLKPAIDLCDGYPMEPQTAYEYKNTESIHKEWKYSKEVFVPAPKTGEIFTQEWLGNTFRKLVEAEQKALKEGKNRKDAIMAAYDRFYKGDIAAEFVKGSQEGGGLITIEDMANWKHHIEKPGLENWPSYVPQTNYKGIDVYKLGTCTQGPVLLQTLNILEGIDLKSMGWNSAKYIHTIYQAMNLAYADRDFYYGDPYFPPEEPIKDYYSKNMQQIEEN
jgi:gamma-glutamyltranspeptidase/glutathione hydrolase